VADQQGVEHGEPLAVSGTHKALSQADLDAAQAKKDKVHPLTVIFHALEDSVKSSAKRKQIIAALAALTDEEIPTALVVAPTPVPTTKDAS
jgi:hypothetical protein